MTNGVFWDVTPSGSCDNRRFGGIYSLHNQGGKNQRPRNSVRINQQLLLLVAAKAVIISLILVILMMEAIFSFETSVLTRATQRNIPQNSILHSHRRGNLKYYVALNGWAL
jgi:hypothetical protein